MISAPNKIDEYLNTQAELIEDYLNSLVPSYFTSPFEKLYESARYALLGGGKRIRPILCLTTGHLLGASFEQLIVPACALEMIHTYSLIHDDLPCMDNDDFRRGKPSLHRQYPEGHAVLTGDFLLTKAFEILATAPQLNDAIKNRLIALIAHYSGGQGMIGGQVMDLMYENKEITLENLVLLHSKKTGALLTASIEFGGMIAEVKPDQLEQLRDFGENIGLTFQIIDDILDVTDSQIKHGRAIASDTVNHKSTFVTLLGLEKAKEYAYHCHQTAIAALDKMDINCQLLKEIAHFILNRSI